MGREGNKSGWCRKHRVSDVGLAMMDYGHLLLTARHVFLTGYSRYRTAKLVTSLVKCTHCTLSSADYCMRVIARWCDTTILYRSKEVLGYAGVLNVDCENNQGSPEQSPERWNYPAVHSWVWL